MVASYISDAFGNSVGGSGSSANPFIWNGGSGYYSDAESGLQKVGARFYDPAVGRWISQDTEVVAGSPADSQAVNRYAYCEGDPVDGGDASGHSKASDYDKAGFAEMMFVSTEVTARAWDVRQSDVWTFRAERMAAGSVGVLLGAPNPVGLAFAASMAGAAGVFEGIAQSCNSAADAALSLEVTAVNVALQDFIDAGDEARQSQARRVLAGLGKP